MKQGILPAALLLVVIGGPVNADDRQARINYMLNCQGCHTPDGSGAPGKVPSLKNFMGNFAQVEGGREFLIQVPGAAQSTLSDAELAEVTNWMLYNFSVSQMPANFQPYSDQEVAALRARTLIDVAGVRAELVLKMADRGLIATP